MNTVSISADFVLQSLRRLPPRERLRIVSQVLPELEAALPVTPAQPLSLSPDFWKPIDLPALVAQQGVMPVTDFEALLGGWPDSESLDPFLMALREWREQSLTTEAIE